MSSPDEAFLHLVTLPKPSKVGHSLISFALYSAPFCHL